MKRRLEDLSGAELANRRVLVRVDFNVPIEEGGVADDTRIRATLPTLNRLAARDARIIVVSHLGRPKGKRDPGFSLEPVARHLGRLVEAPVEFVGDTVGDDAARAVDGLPAGAILVLENIRFEPGEEKNDPELAKGLARFADVYVNDAFGAAHRAHASTAGVADAVRASGGDAVAGFLMERELRFLGEALSNPARPFVAILGGAKISGKIDVIEALLPRVDQLLIGGAMANTFFRGLGLETGTSLVEEDRIAMARALLERGGEKIVLPIDCVVADRAEAGASRSVRERDDIPPDQTVLDIGPRTVHVFTTLIEQARTVLWNGPMGLFEIDDFAEGTQLVAQAVAHATSLGATTIAGGGDTAAAVEKAGLRDRLTHVSTGGGASLEFLEGKPLPGVEALDPAEVT